MARPKSANRDRKVTTTELASGKWRARVQYRDADGETRDVTAQRATERDAVAALNQKIDGGLAALQRKKPLAPTRAAVFDRILPTSTICEAAELLIKHKEKRVVAKRLKPGTVQYYRNVLNSTLYGRTGIGHLAVADVTTAHLVWHIENIQYGTSTFTREMAEKASVKLHVPAPAQAEGCKKLLRQIMTLARQHGAIAVNPATDLPQIDHDTLPPKALTPELVDAVRIAIQAWRNELRGRSGRPRDPHDVVGAAFELMVGTGMRIGEVLALRSKLDVHLDDAKPYVLVHGTVVTITGKGTYRQEAPKTDASRRRITVPPFAVDALRSQLALPGHETYVFATPGGTITQPSNLRRKLRKSLALAGLDADLLDGDELPRIHPHALRKTAATLVARHESRESARDLLGHSDLSVLHHYVEATETEADSADLLQAFFGRPAGENVLALAVPTERRSDV